MIADMKGLRTIIHSGVAHNGVAKQVRITVR